MKINKEGRYLEFYPHDDDDDDDDLSSHLETENIVGWFLLDVNKFFVQ